MSADQVVYLPGPTRPSQSDSLQACPSAIPFQATSHLGNLRSFNTEGPVVPAEQYCIPPLERIGVDRILSLIRESKYFVLHAPRQTGGVSVLMTIQNPLNAGAHGTSETVARVCPAVSRVYVGHRYGTYMRCCALWRPSVRHSVGSRPPRQWIPRAVSFLRKALNCGLVPQSHTTARSTPGPHTAVLIRV